MIDSFIRHSASVRRRILILTLVKIEKLFDNTYHFNIITHTNLVSRNMRLESLLKSIFLLFLSRGCFAVSDGVVEDVETEAMTTAKITTSWPAAKQEGASVQDLHDEYYNIFRYGNRNAASHRWSTFLLDRSEQMTTDRLEMFFSGK